jgi:hypothetical protein
VRAGGEGGWVEEAAEENCRSMANMQEGERGSEEKRECCCVGGGKGVGGLVDWLVMVDGPCERDAWSAGGRVDEFEGGVASGFRIVAGGRGGANDGKKRRGSKSP